MTEAGVVLSKLAVVRILASCVLLLSEFRPFRALHRTMTPTVKRVGVSESAHALPPRRPNPGGFPHFGRPLDAHGTQTPLGQIE